MHTYCGLSPCVPFFSTPLKRRFSVLARLVVALVSWKRAPFSPPPASSHTASTKARFFHTHALFALHLQRLSRRGALRRRSLREQPPRLPPLFPGVYLFGGRSAAAGVCLVCVLRLARLLLPPIPSLSLSRSIIITQKLKRFACLSVCGFRGCWSSLSWAPPAKKKPRRSHKQTIWKVVQLCLTSSVVVVAAARVAIFRPQTHLLYTCSSFHAHTHTHNAHTQNCGVTSVCRSALPEIKPLLVFSFSLFLSRARQM